MIRKLNNTEINLRKDMTQKNEKIIERKKNNKTKVSKTTNKSRTSQQQFKIH